MILSSPSKRFVMTCLWFLVPLFIITVQGKFSKIIGGNDAKIVDIPYQLQLEDEQFQTCGASIIADFFALTSASCVDGMNQRKLTVRSGTDRRSYAGQSHQVLRINIHPKYDSYFHDYDVAVLEVATPFRYDNSTKNISLASSEAVGGEKVRISGWGSKSEESGGVNQLQAVDIPIIPRQNCTVIYSGDVSLRMICAGLEGQDSCRGDTGGPLVNTETNVQVGIRSWSYGCARDGYPGVYTNVADAEIKNFISCVLGGNTTCS